MFLHPFWCVHANPAVSVSEAGGWGRRETASILQYQYSWGRLGVGLSVRPLIVNSGGLVAPQGRTSRCSERRHLKCQPHRHGPQVDQLLVPASPFRLLLLVCGALKCNYVCVCVCACVCVCVYVCVHLRDCACLTNDNLSIFCVSALGIQPEKHSCYYYNGTLYSITVNVSHFTTLCCSLSQTSHF